MFVEYGIFSWKEGGCSGQVLRFDSIISAAVLKERYSVVVYEPSPRVGGVW